MIARKLKATRCRHVQTSFFVASLVQKRNADSAYRIDNFLKGTKVDVDVVIDTDSKVLVNRVDELVRVLAIKCSIDAVGPGRSCDLDPQVARERQEGGTIVFWIDTNDHDGVTALTKACAVAECSGIRRVWVDATSVVRASQQKVFGSEIAFCQIPVVRRRDFRVNIWLSVWIAIE